jgi:hypothetical protein
MEQKVRSLTGLFSALGWLGVVIGWGCFFAGFLMPLKYLLVKGTLLTIARVLP